MVDGIIDDEYPPEYFAEVELLDQIELLPPYTQRDELLRHYKESKETGRGTGFFVGQIGANDCAGGRRLNSREECKKATQALGLLYIATELPANRRFYPSACYDYQGFCDKDDGCHTFRGVFWNPDPKGLARADPEFSTPICSQNDSKIHRQTRGLPTNTAGGQTRGLPTNMLDHNTKPRTETSVSIPLPSASPTPLPSTPPVPSASPTQSRGFYLDGPEAQDRDLFVQSPTEAPSEEVKTRDEKDVPFANGLSIREGNTRVEYVPPTLEPTYYPMGRFGPGKADTYSSYPKATQHPRAQTQTHTDDHHDSTSQIGKMTGSKMSPVHTPPTDTGKSDVNMLLVGLISGGLSIGLLLVFLLWWRRHAGPGNDKGQKMDDASADGTGASNIQDDGLSLLDATYGLDHIKMDTFPAHERPLAPSGEQPSQARVPPKMARPRRPKSTPAYRKSIGPRLLSTNGSSRPTARPGLAANGRGARREQPPPLRPCRHQNDAAPPASYGQPSQQTAGTETVLEPFSETRPSQLESRISRIGQHSRPADTNWSVSQVVQPPRPETTIAIRARLPTPHNVDSHSGPGLPAVSRATPHPLAAQSLPVTLARLPPPLKPGAPRLGAPLASQTTGADSKSYWVSGRAMPGRILTPPLALRRGHNTWPTSRISAHGLRSEVGGATVSSGTHVYCPLASSAYSGNTRMMDAGSKPNSRPPPFSSQLQVERQLSPLGSTSLPLSYPGQQAFGIEQQVELTTKSLLGKGSFGECYLDEMDGIKVVIKVPVSSLNKKFGSNIGIASIRTEAEIMRKMPRHPCVVDYFGWCRCTHEKTTKIGVVFAYYRGGSMWRYLKRGNLNWRSQRGVSTGHFTRLCCFARDIASGVAFLHRNRVIHRDLAARNILLELDNAQPRAIVGDIGFAKELDDNETCKSSHNSSTGDTVVSARWAAPEVLRYGSGKYSCASDVWSFGVIIWEMLTSGDTPWPDMTDRKPRKRGILNHIMNNELDTPSMTPTWMAELVRKCLDRDVQGRPQISLQLDIIKEQLKNL